MATNNARRPRIAVAAAVATTLVAAFAALGGVGVAESAISAAQYQYGQKKVTICHKGKKTIRVGKKAAIAHMRKHGDTAGACANAKAKKAKKAKHQRHEKADKADKKQERKSDRAKAHDDEDEDEDEAHEDGESKGKSKSRGGKGK